MIAYLLKEEKHYYWAMAWAGDSVVAYINRFKEQPTDFSMNEEYFTFSLNIMQISFEKRNDGTFLEKNIKDLGFEDNSKNKSFLGKLIFKPEKKEKPLEFDANSINDKIFNGKEITLDEKKLNAVKELKRVILRYIKWQCIIFIEIQEHELSNDVIGSIKKYLGTTFEKNFKDMVNKVSDSFYCDDEKNPNNVNKDQFIDDIVKKINDIVDKDELKKEREKVRKYLEKILEIQNT